MVLRGVQKAFTLIEVLVALAIFGILSAFAYGALSQTILSAEILGERMDRLQAIQKSVSISARTFCSLRPAQCARNWATRWTPLCNPIFVPSLRSN